MTLFEADASATPPQGPVSRSEIDRALTAQIVVAWAGEGGEDRRMGWWRSDLVAPYGGIDLFRALLPNTWEWAVLQGAREAARRTDADLRRRDADPDRILSLFSLGFALDEQLDQRLQDLKQSRQPPQQALPGLAGTIETSWSRERFADWVRGHAQPEATGTSIGRQLKGPTPSSLDDVAKSLLGALLPLSETYPLPHFRRAK